MPVPLSDIRKNCSESINPIASTLDCPDTNLSEALRQWAIAYGPRTALSQRSQRCTYAELDQRVEHLAAALQQLGLVPGERAMVQLPNGITFITVCFALMRIGVIPVLALPSQRVHDIDALCRIAAPSAYFIADQIGQHDFRVQAKEMLGLHSSLRLVIVDGNLGQHGVPFKQLRALDSSIHQSLPTPAAPYQTALLLTSGGSTGTPKLIPRTHADYLYNFMASAQLCGIDSSTVYLAVLPAAHNFTLACPGILGTLARGGRVVLLDSASCEEALPIIARERVTHLALVPALARLWAQARVWENSDLSSLQLLQVGGAALDAELARHLQQVFGCALQQVFGMAEGLLCYTRLDDSPEIIASTQGRPLSPLDQIRIVDEEDRPVHPGAVGELLVRGPYTIRSYYGAAEPQAASFTADGYYRSGDLVRLDQGGNLIVQGRCKELINRAGEKISPREIELQLKALAGVQDAVVVAVPDILLGERICAFLLFNETASTGVAPPFERGNIREALRQRGLSEIKLPDQIESVMLWPLTAAGKIDKPQLVRSAQSGNANVRRYTESHLKVHSDALELAVRLIGQLNSTCYTMYEHDDQWCIGIDSAMSVQMHADGLVSRSDGTRWQRSPGGAALAQAMSDLPFEDWCAYGRADFEYGHLRYSVEGQIGEQPLVQLHIPMSEIRVGAGMVLIRCLEAQAMPELIALVQAQDAVQTITCDRPLSLSPELPGASQHYQAQVTSALAEMQTQVYQKVILSRQIALPETIDLLASYHQGRRYNTPARSFMLRDGAFQAYGFCPETLLEVAADGQFSTQPLAGTRSLCGNPAADARLQRELLNDPKEVAEHAVSVKLAMEEMAPISAPGSLAVTEFMQVCRRGSVQHLASRVRGKLAPGCTVWRAFDQLFPAVTASGIPKRAALNSIRRHECSARGLYSGCVMLFDSSGMFDAALVLRSVFHDGQRCWLQVGAGVVPLSTPQREWQETCEKLASVARHLQVSTSAG